MADPVLSRIRIVIDRMSQFIKNSPDSKYARFAWILDSMMGEIFDELEDSENGTENLAQWFEQFGKIVEWCGSGDYDVLPDNVKSYMRAKMDERLAITAGSHD